MKNKEILTSKIFFFNYLRNIKLIMILIYTFDLVARGKTAGIKQHLKSGRMACTKVHGVALVRSRLAL